MAVEELTTEFEMALPWALTNLTATVNVGVHSQFYIDSSTEKFAIPLKIRGSNVGETIKNFRVYLGTGGTDADTFDLRIETGDTDGPTGTLFDANATASISTVGGSSGWQSFSINGGTGVTLTSDDFLWVVLSGTGASFSIRLGYCGDYGSSNGRTTSISRIWDGSDWDAIASVGMPMAMWANDSDNWRSIESISPFATLTDIPYDSWDSASNPQCRGMKFTAPYTGKISGVGYNMYALANYDFEVVLVVDGTEAVRTTVGQHNFRQVYGRFIVSFESADVTEGDECRIYFKPLAAPNIYMYSANVASNTELASICENEGVGAVYTSSDDPPTEGGVDSWTDNTDKIPLLWPIYSHLDFGGGDGGSDLVVGYGA